MSNPENPSNSLSARCDPEIKDLVSGACAHITDNFFMHFYIILKPAHACIVSLSLKLRFSLDFFEQPNLYCSLHFFFVRISFSSSKTPIPKFSRAKKFFRAQKIFGSDMTNTKKSRKIFGRKNRKLNATANF